MFKKLEITTTYQANYILRDILGDEDCLQKDSDGMSLENVHT